MSEARRKPDPVDPWHARGWRTGDRWARAAGVLLFVLVPVCGVALALFVGEYRLQRQERGRYVVATGVAGAAFGGDVPQVTVSAPEIGSMAAPAWWLGDPPEPGERVTLLVGRTDPSDFRPWDERARPDLSLYVFLGALATTGAPAGAVLLRARRGRLGLSGVRANAVAVAAPGAPERPCAPERPPATTAAFSLGAPFAFGLVVYGLVVAVVTFRAEAEPVVRTTSGTVVVSPAGYGLRFYDERIGTEWTRPMTSVEARGRRDGETLPVTYVETPEDAEADPPSGWAALLPAVPVLLTVAHLRRRWARDVEAVAAAPAIAVPLVAWRRVTGDDTWLAVAPPGATRLADVLLVPLSGTADVPDAMEGTVVVRGTLRRGRFAVVHGPDGRPWCPAGRVRGPFAGLLYGPSPAAPLPRGA